MKTCRHSSAGKRAARIKVTPESKKQVKFTSDLWKVVAWTACVEMGWDPRVCRKVKHENLGKGKDSKQIHGESRKVQGRKMIHHII